MPGLTKDQKYWIRVERRTASNNIRQCATLEITRCQIPDITNITITPQGNCRDTNIIEVVAVCVGNPDNPNYAGRGERQDKDLQHIGKATGSKGRTNRPTLTEQENNLIGTITEQIEQKISKILKLDKANLHNFEEVENEWSTTTSRIHELKIITQMLKIRKGALDDTQNEITRETTINTRTTLEDPPTMQEYKDYQDSNDTWKRSNKENKEIKVRRLTRYLKYQVIASWANEVMKALKPHGHNTKGDKRTVDNDHHIVLFLNFNIHS